MGLSMNKKRLLHLANLIEAAPHDLARDVDGNGFDMSVWNMDHNCGTTACIAGWAVLTFGAELSSAQSTAEYARALLGLSRDVAAELFMPVHPDNDDREDHDDPEFVQLDYDTITPSMAAAQLRNVAETGQVDPRLWFQVEASA